MKRILFLLGLFTLLAGCDLFGDDPDTTIRATGTVVFAETGEPIEGLGFLLGMRKPTRRG
jgi:hypothetical protein